MGIVGLLIENSIDLAYGLDRRQVMRHAEKRAERIHQNRIVRPAFGSVQKHAPVVVNYL